MRLLAINSTRATADYICFERARLRELPHAIANTLTQSKPNTSHRDTLLLSHANPEDNEFTLWLALQLATEGYKVWSDVTKLLGGEVFWDDIEEVIRVSAAKVLFVLSRTSNVKDGPLKELHLAQSVAKKETLKDFVIPLHIDDLPHGEVTIEITRVNVVPFERSWAAGLAMLLDKLERDGVPKTPQFNRTAVNHWWRTKFSAEEGLRREPEDYLSNWFPVSYLPEYVYFHSISRKSVGKVEVALDLPYPAIQDSISLVTFAEAADFAGKLGPDIYITEESKPIEVAKLLKETDFGRILFRLLRLAWEHTLSERNLPVYELANKTKCFYFSKNRLPNDKVFFLGVDGSRTYRAMVGYSTRTNPTTSERVKRYWHFAVEARPVVYPILAYIFKPHVLFTNDGNTVWESKKRLAAARRSQCKSWWNDEWRDRTLAATAHLCDGNTGLQMKLGSKETLLVSATPVLFQSPVSYTDPQLLRTVEGSEPADDYGRELQDDEVFEDAPEPETK